MYLPSGPSRSQLPQHYSFHVITLEGVTKVFGSEPALDGIDLSVLPGSTALLGRNGAGKTTLINLVSNAVLPTAGNITVNGHPAGSQEASQAIARQLDFAASAGHMTPVSLSRMLHLSGEEVASMRGLLDTFEVPSKPLGKLSKGNQLKLALALVFARERPILLLDEPTAGLDFFGVENLSELIAARASKGLTTLIATHQPTFTPDLFDRALVIERGRLLYDGDLDGLLAMSPDPDGLTSPPSRLASAMQALITRGTP